MPLDLSRFTTFTPRLQEVAQASLNFFRKRYGNNGVKIREEIDPDIGWKPTFYLKESATRLIAVEVDEKLYPEILKIAAHDIQHLNFQICVYQVCPLEVFLADSKQAVINQLKKHGFGIVTVDDEGVVVIQSHCVPIAQHISGDELDAAVTHLRPKVKIAFRSAYDTYRTNAAQGLQEAGQVVENIVNSLVKSAVRAKKIPNSATSVALANGIDELYEVFRNHRAELGGARDFVREYRNIASHPAKTAKQAAEKIRKCKMGFYDAIRIAEKLCNFAQKEKLRVSLI